MEDRARSGSRPLHRPPPPSASFVRRLRAGGLGVVALLAWTVAAPGVVGGRAPAASRAAGRSAGLVAVPSSAVGPDGAEEARLRLEAWQRGREAAAAAERDRAAARRAAGGGGAAAPPPAPGAPAGGGRGA